MLMMSANKESELQEVLISYLCLHVHPTTSEPCERYVLQSLLGHYPGLASCTAPSAACVFLPMASNPPIDAVPLHLRTSNPQDHILRYLSAQAPFIPEFIVKGREHIDRCLLRDAKRDKERKERADNEEKEMKEFEGSVGTSGTPGSSRTSGIVQRMRKKDGSCPGSSSSPGAAKRGRTRSGPVVVVLKRSEVEQGYGRCKLDRVSGTNEGNKENQAPARRKNKANELQETQMLDKMLGVTLDRPVAAKTTKKEGMTKPTSNKKKPVEQEQVDCISMTSSAERELSELPRLPPYHSVSDI